MVEVVVLVLDARLEEPTVLVPPLLLRPEEPPEDAPWLLAREEDTTPLEPPVEDPEEELDSSSVPVDVHPVHNATAITAAA